MKRRSILCGLEKSDKGNLTNSFENGDLSFDMNIQDSNISLETKNISYVIKNTGVNMVHFGLRYTIETLKENVWYEIPFKEHVGFPAQLIGLFHGGDFEGEIRLDLLKCKLSKGEYRAIKEFTSGTSKINVFDVFLAAEFTIH